MKFYINNNNKQGMDRKIKQQELAKLLELKNPTREHQKRIKILQRIFRRQEDGKRRSEQEQKRQGMILSEEKRLKSKYKNSVCVNCKQNYENCVSCPRVPMGEVNVQTKTGLNRLYPFRTTIVRLPYEDKVFPCQKCLFFNRDSLNDFVSFNELRYPDLVFNVKIY